ncbi:HU family DNA-binding protein [uncultured Alistipes sp.]|jgi:DNA-binding protein HU-beta|uniref:HU family DNA-binding protein n=1 Tax=uncultured Alistipes sp. TaxID=538949 RepID=UPI00272D0B29|nr:HU family DNA-binding protein [uncultured Alistipes sp.]
MTKQEIVKEVAKTTGIEGVTVAAVVEGFMEQVRTSPVAGENVYLRRLGTFFLKHRAEKTAHNITKNTTLIVPAHDVPTFKPSPEFRSELQ